MLVATAGRREHEAHELPCVQPVCLTYLFGDLLERSGRDSESPAIAVALDQARSFHCAQLGGRPARRAAELRTDLLRAPGALPLGMQQDKEIELSDRAHVPSDQCAGGGRQW